jgi:hypothetical protein
MAYKPKDQFFPALVEGNVRLTGSSLTLGEGELAFVDVSKTTKDGVKILADFSPLAPTAKLAIRMGEPKDNVSRSEDNKAISTIPFKLQDVVNIYVDAPQKAGVSVDDFIIGYNGAVGSEIDMENAENEVIQVALKGDLMGMIGLPDRKHVANINLTAPITGVKGTDWTMHEIIENAYLELKNYQLPGNIPITNYVDIMLVNSENGILPGTPNTFYNLSVVDDGTYSALGAVQAQYPTADVKRLKWDSGSTTYSVLGTALPAAYQQKADFKLKGCDACPAGYTALEQGFVYEVVIANPTDQTVAVQALPGAELASAVLNDTVGDTNTYSVVTDDELTQAEIDAFIAANLSAVINLIATDVADLCASALPASIAWIAGEVCNSTTEAYTITVADDECGVSRLAEIQAAFPNLVIAQGASAACQTTYTTSVITDLVCEECDPIFRTIFQSEAPSLFDGIGWTKAAKVYSATAKMGIRVRGKRSTLSGNEFLRDDMPFFDGSVEISLVGGFPSYTNESYLYGTNDRFTVKYFSRKSAAHNLGGNLRKFEEEAQMHFRGRSRYAGNNYGKIVNGQETRFEGLKNYIVYSVTIAPHAIASNFQQAQNGAYTYHFAVELGKQGALEDVLNKLAAASGLPLVQAVAK